MAYCKSRTIAIEKNGLLAVFPMRCKSWTCSECAPQRRKKLIAEAIEGQPTRFVTLTCNPQWFDSAAERGSKLAEAWRQFVRAYRKQYPNRQLEYLAVLELTKHGEPHLHIVVRGPYISQQRISQHMREKMGAPVVDIRLIRNKRQVSEYVSKYISKRPIRLGTLKRYWRSLGWFTLDQRLARQAKRGYTRVWMLDFDFKDFINSWGNQRRGYVLEVSDDFYRSIFRPWETGPPGPVDYWKRVR